MKEEETTQPGDDAALYVISVAAELSGLHPQTLRQYDRMGLVSPERATGRGRRYSLRDIASLRTVQRLIGEGINHAGIKRIIESRTTANRSRCAAFTEPTKRPCCTQEKPCNCL